MIGGLRVPLWAGVVVLAVGGLFVAIGVLTTNADRRRRRSWTPLTGVVVGSRLDGDGHQRFQVEYRDSAGTPIRFWNRYTSSGWAATGRLVGSALFASGHRPR